MANFSMLTETEGVCKVNLKIENFTYQNVELLVMKDLCSDILIGHDILNRHSSVEIGFDGNRPPLTICSLAVAQVPPVSLFSNLNPGCRPLVTKSRRQTVEDNIFMALEVQKLLQEGVIEPSNPHHGGLKPLSLEEKIQDSERHYTALTCGKLYQFLRVPLGVTNGVACFQRVIDKIIEDEGLTLTYPFIDDVTVCGKDQKEHDDKREVHDCGKKKYNLTLNEDKCTYSKDIKKVTNSCLICNELKPRFVKNVGTLVKATAPFERLNLDFKGPLPSVSRNHYILTIVDEFSRFPFAIPCSDISAKTVILHLKNIFSIFGMPSFIHSDRVTSFMSQELKSFLTSQGIATSRTTPYNPAGNGQVERYNGIIWKTLQLALRSNSMKTEQWEGVIQTALHSIRSLLCTATNATPHERMFSHPRRSHNGCSIPIWLTKPGPVLMKNQMRANKYEPIVQEVELIETNPDYAHVKLGDGRETTVSIRHLAPRGETTRSEDNKGAEENVQAYPDLQPINSDSAITLEDSAEQNMNTVALCTTSRHRQPPAYLKDYIRD
ncbi:hypothetical protein TNCV_1069321 [Trichonephila clavipes]|nr:hypothetical protein TNCV_1069321 [Trichonephila clavipes]